MANIKELNKEELLSEDTFEMVFFNENAVERTKIILELEERAEKLKIKRNFNKMLKVYQNEFTKMKKQHGSNSVNCTRPPIDNLKCGDWIVDDCGVYKYKIINFENVKISACPHPILPIERLINVDTDTEKVKLAFLKDEKWKKVIVEKSIIASNTAIVKLANRGIDVNSNNSKDLVNYLSDMLEINQFSLSEGVTHLGWVDEDFVPYTDRYIYDGDTSYSNIYDSVTVKGDYDLWKKLVRELRKNSKTLRFVIAASFASSLVSILQINPFIVHIWGKSGNGKTVAQMVCASVWGNPAKGKLLSSLDNTKVALERMMNFLSNLPLIADELQLTKNIFSNYDQLIYQLTEGKGKDRGTVDTGLTNVTEWDNIIITSGEEPITGSNSKEGVKNRVFEINDDNTIIKEGNKVVNYILNNYGYAGKEFINLIDKNKIKDRYNELCEELKNVTESKKQINAMACILVADEVVSEKIFNDNKFKLEEIKDYFTKDIDEAERYKNAIYDFFYLNINKFEESQIGEVWGKYEKIREEITCFYINCEILKKFLKEKGINFDGIKNKLFEVGALEKNSQGKYTFQTTVNGIKQNLFKINVIDSKNDILKPF